MPRRFNILPPADSLERARHARDTLAFCEVIYLIHSQSHDPWQPELLALKSLQRAALAALSDNCDRWEWM